MYASKDAKSTPTWHDEFRGGNTRSIRAMKNKRQAHIRTRCPWTRAVMLLGIILVLGGCASTGPGSIVRDRFDYTAAIKESWRQQLLANIVGLRYAEPPVFVDVASIISQYELQGELSASLSDGASLTGGDIYSLGANASYSERPTITYQPQTGSEFARNLLTPLPPSALLSLVQSGYPVDFLFRIGARVINGIQNRADVRIVGQVEDPEFDLLMEAMRRIQTSGLIGSKIVENEKDESVILFFGDVDNAQVASDVRLVRDILKLEPDRREFNVIFGPIAPDRKTIAIKSRSIMEILLQLAADVDVPQAHIDEGRTNRISNRGNNPDGERLMQVRSQRERPDDAYARVFAHGYWYYVDNRDQRSKRVMAFMMILTSLAQAEEPAQLPVVTVGAGGG